MSQSHLLQIRVPEGVYAGSNLNVQAEDGKLFAIVVPDGVGPGDTLCVDIRDAGPGATSVVVTTPESTAVARADSSASSFSGSRAALGAAAVGAVVGTLLIGPITGVVVAGAALYATTRDDKVGGAARATGTGAVTIFDKARESAEKHHVGEKLAAASAATAKKAAELDEQYKITENVKVATASALSEAKKLNEKYDITGSAARALMSGAAAVTRIANQSSDPKPQSKGSSVTTV